MSLAGKWGYSTNEERYYGDFDTKEEAIHEAEACEDVGTDYWVGQFKDIVVHVDADRIIEQAQEDAYEEAGDFSEDWLGNVSRDKRDELSQRLTSTFKSWLSDYGLHPTFAVVDQDTIEQRTVSADGFSCCGGNDDTPKEHNMDCDEFNPDGTPKEEQKWKMNQK